MILIFIFIIIIIFVIIMIWFCRKALSEINSLIIKCDEKNINDYDCETLSIVKRYLEWSILLLIIIIIVSIISILLSVEYGKIYVNLFGGWELWGIVFFISLLSTGLSLLLSFSASYLTKIQNRENVSSSINNMIISASMIMFVSSLLYISNVIFFYTYLRSE